jgi:hypothetical protein
MQVLVREMLQPACRLRALAENSPSATVPARCSVGSGALCVVLCARLWRERSGQLPVGRRVLVLATLLAALSVLQVLRRPRSGAPAVLAVLAGLVGLPPASSLVAAATVPPLSVGRLLSLLVPCGKLALCLKRLRSGRLCKAGVVAGSSGRRRSC